MTYACDVCLSICRSPELAVVSGWWGSEEVSSASARKTASYRSVLLEAEEQERVSGHICRSCVEKRLAKDIRVNVEKPRSVIREERRQQYPNESAFTNLRKTVPVIAEVVCDRCHESCRERYYVIAAMSHIWHLY